MIRFFSENKFQIKNKREIKKRLNFLITNENKKAGEINFIFCDDEYLLEINQSHLNHDYFTDIITFNYNEEDILHSDIYISTERVLDNAHKNNTSFENEINRVMYHGLLHLCGYKDKTAEEKRQMREKEDYYLNLQT